MFWWWEWKTKIEHHPEPVADVGNFTWIHKMSKQSGNAGAKSLIYQWTQQNIKKKKKL